MRQLDSPTTFESVKVVGSFGGKRQHLLVPADKKGEWLVMPPKFKVVIDDGSIPYDLEIDFIVNSESKVIEVKTFKASKRDVQITSKGLRDIPLATIRGDAIREVGLLMIEGEDGKMRSNLLEPKKDVSHDVIQRAIRRRNKNSRDVNESKQVADFVAAMLRKNPTTWQKEALEEFHFSRATLNRHLDKADFSVRNFKKNLNRKAKKK